MLLEMIQYIAWTILHYILRLKYSSCCPKCSSFNGLSFRQTKNELYKTYDLSYVENAFGMSGISVSKKGPFFYKNSPVHK